MAKTLAAIEKALGERYSGNTYEKKGMTYAAWEDIVYAANDIFGALGWSREFVKAPYREGNGFACILRVTVYFIDDDGTLRSIPFEAPGYNELSDTRDGVEMTDTAFKGAYADALKKVLQALGDAFALFIGAEAKAAKGKGRPAGTDNVVRPAAAANNGGGNGGWASKLATEGMSEKQIWSLQNKYGVSDEELETLTCGEGKAILDNGGRPGQVSKSVPAQRAAATASRVGTPDDEDSDNPFA